MTTEYDRLFRVEFYHLMKAAPVLNRAPTKEDFMDFCRLFATARQRAIAKLRTKTPMERAIAKLPTEELAAMIREAAEANGAGWQAQMARLGGSIH